MRDQIFHLQPEQGATLHSQLREMLVTAILEGQLPAGSPLPSSRRMATLLGVARNTVVHAYQELVLDGFLESRARSGYYVNGEILEGLIRQRDRRPVTAPSEVDWPRRLRARPAAQRNVVKPRDWQRYPYPFICGQFDPDLFPLADWRECSRLAHSVQAAREWAADALDGDDPTLVEQIRTRLLPRRGVRVPAEQILVTVGAQQGLYLVARLLMGSEATVGIEDPGYPDARNIFALESGRLVGLPVDDDGLVVDGTVAACDIIYTTPSHQVPTTVTMPLARREALLRAAHDHDLVVIEDEYESEINFLGTPSPALKSLDTRGRVIFVSSLSKTLAPGLRLGFMVAPPDFIREARALRRLMVRHPPANNQRTIALFLARGSHDALLRRLTQVYKERWALLGAALDRHLPQCTYRHGHGGTAFWISGPPRLDAVTLAARAREEGIIIEPGDVDFLAEPPPRNHFRLGFSSIPKDRIEPGLERLGQLVEEQLSG
jgi:GntR family transcriptional regulator/MocR family aminotransferase